MAVEADVQRWRGLADALRSEVGRVIVGQSDVVEQMIVCLFAGGHALIEGVPGLGKTLLVRTLSRCTDLKFARIQFTPDLMPADILGTNILMEDASGRRSFQFQKGAIFANVILADEINRATPKTQSALLEAMQEKAVTVAGERYRLEGPFFVFATQNPIEMEGTYPLPEAQLDRFFFKIVVPRLDEADIVGVLKRTTGAGEPEARKVLSSDDFAWMCRLVRDVPVAEHVMAYVAKLVFSTHPGAATASEAVRKFVRYGASPRAAQALVLGGKVKALLGGRLNVGFDDIRSVLLPVLRHRMILNFEAEAEGVAPEDVLDNCLKGAGEPAGK